MKFSIHQARENDNFLKCVTITEVMELSEINSIAFSSLFNEINDHVEYIQDLLNKFASDHYFIRNSTVSITCTFHSIIDELACGCTLNNTPHTQKKCVLLYKKSNFSAY